MLILMSDTDEEIDELKYRMKMDRRKPLALCPSPLRNENCALQCHIKPSLTDCCSAGNSSTNRGTISQGPHLSDAVPSQQSINNNKNKYINIFYIKNLIIFPFGCLPLLKVKS